MLCLATPHKVFLQALGIDPAVARERGYRLKGPNSPKEVACAASSADHPACAERASCLITDAIAVIGHPTLVARNKLVPRSWTTLFDKKL